jgi:ubiquitin-conjugating enzyme E2 O
VHPDGHYGGWRKTMADIDIAHRREQERIVEGKIRKPGPDDRSLNWFGEVSNVFFSRAFVEKLRDVDSEQ